MADDVAGDPRPEQVRVQPLELGGDDADILPALGHLNAVDGLDRHRVGQRMGVRADAAHTLDQHQGLDGVALGGQLLDAAVVIAHKDLRVLDDLALGIELGVDGLLQRRMVRADGNDIAHLLSPLLLRSTSSLSGVTMIWPRPCGSSISSGKNSRWDRSSPSNVTPKSSLSSRSAQVAAAS